MISRIKKRARENDGFTLIEFIAVLVILAILAAVAVPKFFSLQSEAAERAADGALGEAAARINVYYAKQVLQGVEPANIDYTALNAGGADDASDLGDFTMSIQDKTPTANEITITVTGKNDPDVAPALQGYPKTKVITRPS